MMSVRGWTRRNKKIQKGLTSFAPWLGQSCEKMWSRSKAGPTSATTVVPRTQDEAPADASELERALNFVYCDPKASKLFIKGHRRERGG